MIYSQVLWALALDRILWHVGMNFWTLLGVGSVVGSLTLVSLAKEMPHFARGRRAKHMLQRRRQRYEAVPPCDAEDEEAEGGRGQAGSVAMDEIDMDDLYDEQDVFSA